MSDNECANCGGLFNGQPECICAGWVECPECGEMMPLDRTYSSDVCEGCAYDREEGPR